jgi:hypothetical protein
MDRQVMPLFYLDFEEGNRLITHHEEAIELIDLDAAQTEATDAAAGIARDILLKGTAQKFSIHVRDEDQQRVLSVTVSIQIQRG